MKFGKTIKLFLIDGEPNGRMSCELSNWSGKAYKIPRIKIKNSTDRDELNKTGVYLLLGKNDEDQDQVYIGEAESIMKRLNQHLAQKEFWHEVIVFFSKDDNLNKAHIKYLENRLHELAVKAKRYSIENSIVPTQSSISESDKAEMEEFIENIKLLVNTLGHKLFDEKRDTQSKAKQDIFYIKATRGADAQGEPTSEGFVVFKGSKAAGKTVPSITSAFINLKQTLISKNILSLEGDQYVFAEDHLFSSPSTAAMVVLGRNANGLTEWKLSNGKTLRDYEAISD